MDTLTLLNGFMRMNALVLMNQLKAQLMVVISQLYNG
jgi:hypothetical protein